MNNKNALSSHENELHMHTFECQLGIGFSFPYFYKSSVPTMSHIIPRCI